MPYFVEKNASRRFLQALTGIVALAVIILGITDYLQRQKESKLSSTPIVVNSDAGTVPGKTSRKMRRTRTSATKASTSAAMPAAEDAQGPVVSAEFAAPAALRDAPKAVKSEHTHNGKNSALSRTSCVPLPNSTRAEDVDAPYYQNWAGEYGCLQEGDDASLIDPVQAP